MGYIPSSPPLPYPMTRNSVPPPPSPPPTRVIREDAPLLFRPKKKAKEMKIEIITHDYDNEKFIKYSNVDGYRIMKLGRHGSLIDIDTMKHMDEMVDALTYNSEQLYSLAVVSYSDKNEVFGKIVIDESKKYANQVAKYADTTDYYKKLSVKHTQKVKEQKKPRFPPNMLINEATGEVTYQYVDDRVIADQAQADHHAEWEVETAKPRNEWHDIFPEKPKNKSLWERIIDRIILNIVWGK